MKKACAPKAKNVSSKLGSYKNTIGKNQSGKAVKPVGLVKAKKG